VAYEPGACERAIRCGVVSHSLHVRAIAAQNAGRADDSRYHRRQGAQGAFSELALAAAVANEITARDPKGGPDRNGLERRATPDCRRLWPERSVDRRGKRRPRCGFSP